MYWSWCDFSLKVPGPSFSPEIMALFEVSVAASDSCVYEICLIPDPEHRGFVKGLKLEGIINNAIISGEKQGPGTFKLKSHHDQYILLLNCFASGN